jgi:hypothetical protein
VGIGSKLIRTRPGGIQWLKLTTLYTMRIRSPSNRIYVRPLQMCP